MATPQSLTSAASCPTPPGCRLRSSRMNIVVAKAAVAEALSLNNSNGDVSEIGNALELALKALGEDPISDADLDKVHPAVAHRLRDQGQPGT